MAVENPPAMLLENAAPKEIDDYQRNVYAFTTYKRTHQLPSHR